MAVDLDPLYADGASMDMSRFSCWEFGVCCALSEPWIAPSKHHWKEPHPETFMCINSEGLVGSSFVRKLFTDIGPSLTSATYAIPAAKMKQ